MPRIRVVRGGAPCHGYRLFGVEYRATDTDIKIPYTENSELRKHLALHPQKPLKLIRDGADAGVRDFTSNTYSLHCHHQNDSALKWAVV